MKLSTHTSAALPAVCVVAAVVVENAEMFDLLSTPFLVYTLRVPSTSDVAGTRNVYTKNGVDNKSNISAFSVTTAATTHTAGTAGDVWVISYTTAFVSP